MIYLDNAATTWPKPDCVQDAMQRYFREVGANPGRSGHRLANEAERLRFDAREAAAELFGAGDPQRVVFTLNGTMALNMAIQGLLRPGSHAITTGMEHNAVMRPLRQVETQGVEISLARCQPDGSMVVEAVEEVVRPDTGLIVINHASNVCGTVLPIREVGDLARGRGIPLLVDATQTGGCWPIDMEADHIDLLAFTGHKGLYGPSGTGGLVISDGFDTRRLAPLVRGGTGSRSEFEIHPDCLPDRYEAGTPNMVGLAGLAAAVRFVLARGVNTIREHEKRLTRKLIEGLRAIRGVHVLGTCDADRQTATVSFNASGRLASEVAFLLDEQYEILCRPGLHCAPRAHRTLGTFPEGAVRFALGLFNSDADVDGAVDAVRRVAETERK